MSGEDHHLALVPHETRLADLAAAVRALVDHVLEQGTGILADQQSIPFASAYRASAANLAFYMALRRKDIRDLQVMLSAQGLSSLGRCEPHVMYSVAQVARLVHALAGENFPRDTEIPVADHPGYYQGRKLVEQHTLQLFGKTGRDRRSHIMVTLPTEAGKNPALTLQLVRGGMNCARINCAHDSPQVWSNMVNNIHQAKASLEQGCKIVMDLAGPKLRTGKLPEKETLLPLKGRHYYQKRNQSPRYLLLRSDDDWRDSRNIAMKPGDLFQQQLFLPQAFFSRLQAGDILKFNDMRGKSRELEIVASVGERGFRAISEKTGLVARETRFTLWRRSDGGGYSMIAKTRPTHLPREEVAIRVYQNDRLHLSSDTVTARPAVRDKTGKLLQPASIGLSHPDLLQRVAEGQTVWIDDGKLGGEVVASDESGITLKIHHCPTKGYRLAGDKGINFPDTELAVGSLTEKDEKDLAFVVRHADIVSLSFTESAADVARLQALLERLGARNLGILLKIETKRGIQKLPEILFQGMKSSHPLGVMIARGDLAVEVGGERMAELQEEILWLAEAAHLPVVWATQVLETFIKKGRISRPEMTDAAMAGRAECVMLNKGPYVVEAVAVLDDILSRMEGHQYKKNMRFRALHW